MYIILVLIVDVLVLCKKGVRLLCIYLMFRSVVFYKKKIVFIMCFFRLEDDDFFVINFLEFIFFREYMY